MGQLLFKKCFWDAIRSGTKRTTIRRWASPRLKAGGRAFSPGVGWLTIDSVDVIDDLDRLDDDDARADGFETSQQMRKALRTFYPSAGRDGRQWFRVAFRPESIGKVKSPPKRRKRRTSSPRRRRGTRTG